MKKENWKNSRINQLRYGHIYILISTRITGIIMIVSFKDKEAAKIFNQVFSRVLPVSIQEVTLRKLIMIDKAKDLNDLRIPPSNHLEKLKGKLKNKFSIRINNQYKICFLYINGNFYDLEIIDYH